MTAEPVNPDLDGEDGDEDEIETDLDLDAEDAVLIANIGEGTVIRWRGEYVTFPPMEMWEYRHNRAMSVADYDNWARGVLSKEDFDIWMKWNLRNYQMVPIVAKIMTKAGMTVGKASGSRGSSRNTGPRSKRTSRGRTR